MLSISHVAASPVQPYPTAARPEPAARAPQDAQPSVSRRPVMDEYIPEKKPEETPEAPETCTASTDRVDHEIDLLRKRQADLKQRLQSETDPTRTRALEQQLAQVERELLQKDTDTYRRQHAVFT